MPVERLVTGVGMGCSNYKKTRSTYSWSRFWPSGSDSGWGNTTYKSKIYVKQMSISYSSKYDYGKGSSSWAVGSYAKRSDVNGTFYIGCNTITDGSKYKKGSVSASSESVSSKKVFYTNVLAENGDFMPVPLTYTFKTTRNSNSAPKYYVDQTAISPCPWFMFSFQQGITESDIRSYTTTFNGVTYTGAHIVFKLPEKSATSTIRAYLLTNNPSTTNTPVYDTSRYVSKTTTTSAETLDFNVTNLVITMLNNPGTYKGIILVCNPNSSGVTDCTSAYNNLVNISATGISVLGITGNSFGSIFKMDLYLRVGGSWVQLSDMYYKTGGSFKKLSSFLTRTTVSGSSDWR